MTDVVPQIPDKDLERVQALLADVRAGVSTVKDSVSSWRERFVEGPSRALPALNVLLTETRRRRS